MLVKIVSIYKGVGASLLNIQIEIPALLKTVTRAVNHTQYFFNAALFYSVFSRFYYRRNPDFTSKL